ncbi:autotransporter outer membrane beta-barrel domain-containing protein, partial [Campylobacter lanienae]|uniref:autotransporter outer membrane beta-barrel domain-containing protein n=1 Tax=Campylobacter lanienae TaxID=75658 RepID=UPI002A90A8EC
IGGESKTGSATQNSIWILGNSSGHIIGGKTDSGSASNNQINIDGINTKGDIIGGLTTGNGQTDRNQIIARGDINGSIYGGYKGQIGKGTVQGNNNTVTLTGDLARVTGNIQVGSVDGRGNTLNIHTNNPVILEGNISGAQTISIAVSNIGAGNSAVIIGKNGFIDVKNATVTADLKLKPNVNVGDNIKLITAEDGNNSRIDGDLSKINVNVSSELFNMAISLNADGNLIVSDKKTNEKQKPISEGLISGAAAVFVASENAANKGVESAITSTSANVASARSGASVIAPFASSTGGTSKIKTGSYVKTTGISVILGAANGRYTDNGKLTVGPFIEMGKNSYSTHNDFGDGKGEVRGDGDSKYIGAGLLARYDFGSTTASRPYIEGSARFGKNYNKYENTNITSNGKHAKYDMNTNYFGVHMGGGYEFRRDNQALDLYTKYLYNNLAGDKIDIMDMPYDFKAVESHKLLTGARYKVDLDPVNNFKLSPYAGAALDYELKGSADVFASGFNIDSPSLKGASAMLEAGLSINANGGFSVDVGLFGHVGKRQGINGLANIKFEF